MIFNNILCNKRVAPSIIGVNKYHKIILKEGKTEKADRRGSGNWSRQNRDQRMCCYRQRHKFWCEMLPISRMDTLIHFRFAQGVMNL